MSKLSIIIPVYYNEMNLVDLYNDLKEKVLDKLDDYEIVFVDDGSKDKSYDILLDLKKLDDKIVVIKLSRNFGSHAAILAGLNNCTGDCAAMKAADLQEPSEMILEMYEKWKNGDNVVIAIRADRQESAIQKFFSNTYYKIMQKIAIKDMPNGGFDCFLIDRKVMKVLELMDEKNSTLMGQILWSGFRTGKVYYTRLERKKGKSRWTLRKKIKLFTDSILSFSFFPIRCVTGMGIIVFILSIVWAIYIFISKVYGDITIEGWTTLMITNLFFYGIVLLTLGIIGEYLWRTLDASRNRPTYIIEEMKGADKNERDNSSRR